MFSDLEAYEKSKSSLAGRGNKQATPYRSGPSARIHPDAPLTQHPGTSGKCVRPFFLIFPYHYFPCTTGDISHTACICTAVTSQTKRAAQGGF